MRFFPPKGFPHTNTHSFRGGEMTAPFTAAPKSTVWCLTIIYSRLQVKQESACINACHVLLLRQSFHDNCVSLNMIKTPRPPIPPHPTPFSHTHSSDLREYGDDDEDHQDTTVNQMLVPRSHQEDATLILNNLLKEYDKTLRPDIGGKNQVGLMKSWGLV